MDEKWYEYLFNASSFNPLLYEVSATDIKHQSTKMRSFIDFTATELGKEKHDNIVNLFLQIQEMFAIHNEKENGRVKAYIYSELLVDNLITTNLIADVRKILISTIMLYSLFLFNFRSIFLCTVSMCILFFGFESTLLIYTYMFKIDIISQITVMTSYVVICMATV